MFRQIFSAHKIKIALGLSILALALSGLGPVQASSLRPGVAPVGPGSQALKTAVVPTSLAWSQANQAGFGTKNNSSVTALEVFSGQLYAATQNGSGAQIWRTPGGRTWTQFAGAGFGNPAANMAVLDMIVFKNDLYVSTGWGSSPGQIWRTDGTGWDQIDAGGFGHTDNASMAALAVFGSQLYVATQNSSGLQIWRSPTGNSGDWSRVVEGGNGNAHNVIITGMAEFNGYLYAAVENGTDGAEVWRTDNGTTWTPVSTDGFGSAANTQTGGFAIMNGVLYIGTRNDSTGGQVWRSDNGTTWTQAVGNGFGDLNNFKVESLISMDGFLLAGTDNNTTGIEFWRSYDGTSWAQVNRNGFNHSSNTGTLWSDATVVYNNDLFIGTSNSSDGGAVWTAYETGTWTPVAGPPTAILRAVAMRSKTSGWAVGNSGFDNQGHLLGPIILRWDGNSWTTSWSDTNYVNLLTVANFQDGTALAAGKGGDIWRWNGSAWNYMDRAGDNVNSLGVLSASDFWAVGGGDISCSAGIVSQYGTLVHWNGSAWSSAAATDLLFSSVAMVSPTNGWAVGHYCYRFTSLGLDQVSTRALFEYWNGSAWNFYNSPSYIEQINSVDMLSSSDEGWAVGFAHGMSALLHYVGGQGWNEVESPNTCNMQSVDMVSADDGWAVGYASGNTYCASTSVIMHWNGTSWSEVVSPVTNGLLSVSMVSADEGWAVGGEGVILHYKNNASRFILSVSRTGSGSGTVTSAPGGIDCGATCLAFFDPATSVTLTATPAAGSVFSGWSGADCPGVGACTATMDAARSITAAFSVTQSVYLPLARR